ncbi:MAG: hypothetical protein HZA54_14085, partial [Planctomycetes bacterium]|nr:hypothetical protein [Planctomycetota bacterium]
VAAAPPPGTRVVCVWTAQDEQGWLGLYAAAARRRQGLVALIALESFEGRPGRCAVVGEVSARADVIGESLLAALGETVQPAERVPHGLDELARFLPCRLAGIAVKERGTATEIVDLGDAEALARGLGRFLEGLK